MHVKEPNSSIDFLVGKCLEMPGRIFVISGPSGVGKGTLVERLMGCRDGFWLSVSATTRSPREGEIPNVSYIFLDEDDFKRRVASDGFLEWAKVHDHYYGTLREPVEERLAEKIDVILEIDPYGAFQVKEKHPEAFLLFVMPPSFETLKERLKTRGTETAEQIERRLETARIEIPLADRYNHTIINDELERATSEFISVIDSNR